MKKVNKKAILGFAMSMIFSLAIMQGISQKNVQQQDMNMQQVCAGAAYVSVETEGGWSAAAGAVSIMAGAYAVNVASALVTAAPVSTTTPVGWGAWISVGVACL